MPEVSPVGEHQVNGTVEQAARTVRDQARVLKLHMAIDSDSQGRYVGK